MLSLINDLLDMAKIESGKVELQLETVDCRAVLAEVADALSPLAKGKGIGFTAELPPEGTSMRTDRRALSQILINLCNNAIKFTDGGGVRIEFEQERGGGKLTTTFNVIDTGIGIRPEDQARLFQAFGQVAQLGAGRVEGTGLGLHLSQKLAGLLGGSISFTSEYGRGSTFTLKITGS